jgi:PAS domain S-box-containing protein
MPKRYLRSKVIPRSDDADLQTRLEEAEETLRAIRSGEVDALVVSTDHGDQIFTLKGADHPFRILIENMSEGALTVTEEGLILYANNCFAGLLELPLEKVIGASLFDFIAPDGRDVFMQLLQKKDGRRRLATLDIVSCYDNLIPAQLSLINLQMEDELSNICVVVTDLTEHKKAEAAINAERQARIKSQESERANQAKSRFLANISHEIRTPMNVILGMSNLAYESAHSPELKEYINMIRESTISLIELINDILDYTRIEAEGLHLAQLPIHLPSFIEKIMLSLSNEARKKGLKFIFSLDDNVPRVVLGDHIRLQQVILNLLGNAIKFTFKGEVALNISLDDGVEKEENVTKEVVPVRFVIRDTGIGIPLDKMENIFEVFVQGENIQISGQEGTGLGLPISKNLVELMRGTIGFDSKENQGSTFYFTIPFSLPVENQDANEKTKSATSRIESSGQLFENDHHRALNILLVEDKPMNQKMTTIYLEKKGHNVTTASNGMQALEMYKSQQFDLILMDIHMPVMNGFEAASLIRTLEAKEGGHIPIIAVTAYAMEEDRVKCLQRGMDFYISKPIDINELYAALDKAMGRS